MAMDATSLSDVSGSAATISLSAAIAFILRLTRTFLASFFVIYLLICAVRLVLCKYCACFAQSHAARVTVMKILEILEIVNGKNEKSGK